MSAFKLYIHCGDKCTVLKWKVRPTSLTKATLIAKIIKTYNKKYQPTIDTATSSFTFDTESFEKLQNKDDLTVTINVVTSSSSPPPSTTTSTTLPTPPITTTPTSTQPKNSKKSIKKIKNPLQQALRPLLKGASDCFAKKQYRKAKSIYNQILDLDTGKVPNTAALYGLAKVAAANNKHAEVLAATFPNIASISPNVATPNLDDIQDYGVANNDPPFLELLGDTLFHLKHLRSAIRCYDETVQIILKLTNNKPTTAQLKEIDLVKIKMSNVLYAGGEHGSAIQVIQDVLSRGEDNSMALLAYAKAAWDQDQKKAAIEVTMKALVLDTENKKIKQQLSLFVTGHANLLLDIFVHVKTVEEGGDVNSANGTAQALAFLATVVKDHGAIDECIEIYERVVLLSPYSASYCLNLMHAYELQMKYETCLARAATFGRLNQGIHLKKGLVKGQVKACIDPFVLTKVIEHSCNDVFRTNLKNCLSLPKEQTTATTTATTTDTDATTNTTITAGATNTAGATQEENEEDPTLWTIQWEDGEDNGAVVISSDGSTPVASKKKRKPPKLDSDLDLLAIFFTVTKVLYIKGKLKWIPFLISNIEHSRRGQSLHTTTVRNEHAYYCCIAQLLSIPYVTNNEEDVDGKNSNSSQGDVDDVPLIVCGDSHSLTSAWRSVNGRYVQPLLVTGLKAWHLRKESNFYPKKNFENAMKCLPNRKGTSSTTSNSTQIDVIFLFCEIDCREGILMAVEKDRYDTIEDGIKKNVSIYIHTLLKIKKKKNIRKLYVHPSKSNPKICFYNSVF